MTASNRCLSAFTAVTILCYAMISYLIYSYIIRHGCVATRSKARGSGGGSYGMALSQRRVPNLYMYQHCRAPGPAAHANRGCVQGCKVCCACQPWLCAGVQSLLVHANRGCVQGCLLERANHGRVQGVCACMPNRVVCRGVCLCKLTVVVREGVCLCKPTIMVVCRGVCVCMPTMVVCSDVCVCMPTIAVRMGVCFPVSLKFVPDMAARPPCTWQVRSTRGAEPLAYEGGMCVQSATARGGSMDEP
jgi:hypothetical protein